MNIITNYFLLLAFAFGFSSIVYVILKTIKII